MNRIAEGMGRRGCCVKKRRGFDEKRRNASHAASGVAVMDSRSWDRLRELLEGNEWVKGAVNYDEDLHFSTFYLRASCAHVTAPLYPGYTAIVAFYSGFNESYYLLKHECQSTAEAIVRKALRRPAWL